MPSVPNELDFLASRSQPATQFIISHNAKELRADAANSPSISWHRERGSSISQAIRGRRWAIISPAVWPGSRTEIE